MLVGAPTRDGAAFGWVGRGVDGVLLQVEVRYVVCVFGDGEAERGIVRDGVAVFSPFQEDVSLVGGGVESTGFKVVVVACAGDGSAFVGIGVGGDHMCVDGEVGDERPGAGHDEGEGVGSPHNGAVLGPVDEVVAFVWRGDEGAYVEVVVGSPLGDGSAFGRIDGSLDRIAVDGVRHRHVHVVVRHVAAHYGHIRAVAFDGRRGHRVGSAVGEALAEGRRGGHAVGCHVGNRQGVAVDQVGHRHVHVVVRHVAAHYGHIRAVAFDGRRGHRVGSAVGEALAEGRRSGHAVGCHVGDCQGVAVELEVCHEGGVLCHDDLKGVGGGDDGVVDGPVEEEVGGVLGGDEGGGVAVGVGTRTGDGAALIGFRQGGYLVSVPVKEVVDGGSGLVVSNGDRVAIEGFVDALVVLGGGGAAVGAGIDLAAVVTRDIGVEEVGVIDTELVLSLEGDGGVGDAVFAILIQDKAVHVAPAGDLHGDGVGRSGLAWAIHGGDIIKVSAHVVGQGAVAVARVGRAVDQNPVTIDVVVSE